MFNPVLVVAIEMPTDVRRVQQPVYRARAVQPSEQSFNSQDTSGRPVAGFAENVTEEGTYRGEWQDGQPHGTGTFFYHTGVRYSGSWRNGRPFGDGAWTREKPRVVPPKRGRTAQCKCKIPRHLIERQVIEPISYSVYLKHEWPRGVNRLDRKAFARCVACWWPGGPYDLGTRQKETNPKVFADFYKRVLSDKTNVEIIAVNELPLGCRGGQTPKVLWEMWCADPDRKDSDGGRGMPMAVMYVRFCEDYSQSHEARHSSVQCIHATFCRIQEEQIAEDFAHTGGVENCENLWTKVIQMEETLHHFHTVEVRDARWKWRQPWELTMHCSKSLAGEPQDCWTPSQAVSELKTVGGTFENYEHVCEECFAFAAIRKLMDEALEAKSGPAPLDGLPDLRAPIVSRTNMLVDGLCLPISVAEHTALESYGHAAILFSFHSQPSSSLYNGLALFCEHLESLHWKTQLIENATKVVAERAISANVSSSKFTKGANMYLFVGCVVRIREATYILPDDAQIVSSFRHNRVDWEEEIKIKAFSLDWLQEQLAAVRVYGASPCLIFVDGHVTSGDCTGHYVPTCKHRAYNSMALRIFRESNLLLVGSPTTESGLAKDENGCKFLSRLQYAMIQRSTDLRDMLMRLNAVFGAEHSPISMIVDYDGLRQNFMFHPAMDELRTHEVEPEDRIAFVQAFGKPLLWGPPPDTIAARPDLMNRKVRLPSLGAGAQDCLDYLESRCLESQSTSLSTRANQSWIHGTCLLHGDHGTGKTTIAAALTHRLYYKRSCNAFFWLHGANSSQLYHDCLSLAKFLALVDDKEDKFETVLARLRQWMTLHPGWFVVLEDAEDEAVVDLLDFPISDGMLLITSRPAHWKSVLWQNVVELSNLTPDEGHTFVLRTLKNEQPSAIDSLLRELHYHPLSVSLALSFMRQQKMKLLKFMASKKPLDFSAEMRYCAVGMTSKERGYLTALMSVVAPIVTAFNKMYDVLPRMLVACACCNADGIHRNIFEDDKDCDKFFDTLISYGCLEVSGDATLHMNPLLQLAIREHFTNLKEAGLQHLCDLLERGMSFQKIDRTLIREERGAWIAHVLEAESLGGTFSFPFLRACAQFMAGNMHDFDEPLRLFKKLRQEASLKDTDYQRMLSVALHTGEIHLQRQEFHEAQFQLEQFLKMFEDLDCQHDAVFAKAVCLVGKCFHSQGRHADALNRYEHALYACSQFHLEESKDGQTGGWFDFFFQLQMEMEDVQDLEAMSRTFLLDLARATELPTDCLQLVKITRNTKQSPFREMESGIIIAEMKVKNDIQSFLPHGNKCKSPLHLVQNLQRMCQMSEDEMIVGVKHQSPLKQGKTTALIQRVSCASLEGAEERVMLLRADILCNIGGVLMDLEDYALAESKYNEALHIQNGVLEQEARKIAAAQAHEQRQQGSNNTRKKKESVDPGEARAVVHASTDDLIRVAATLFKIAESRAGQRHFDKAIEAIDECRSMRIRVWGHEHRGIAELHELHGRICHEQAHYREAVFSFDRARRMFRTMLGPRSWESARVAVCLGMTQDQLGQLDSAAAEYSSALSIFETFKDTLNAARCANNLAIIHRKQGNHAQAFTLLSSAKAVVSSRLGTNNIEFAGILRNVGSVHFDLQAWKEAQTEWQASLKVVKHCSQSDSVEGALILMNLGSIHLKMCQYHDAHEKYGQSYALLVKVSGPRHVDTARALVGLGTSNEKLGDIVLARKRLEAALVVMRQALGDSHLEVCHAEMNLATVLLKEASARTQPQDDGSFPSSAIFVVELAIKNLEDIQDSKSFRADLSLELAKALDMDPALLKVEKVVPERNEVEIRVFKGAAGTITPAELVQKIVHVSRDKSSKIFEGNWGSKMKSFSGLEEASTTANEAVRLYKHVIKVRAAKYDESDLEIGNATRCIGNALWMSGERNAAIAEFWKALRIFEIRLGKEHDDTVSTYRSIESALDEELLLARKTKDAKAQALHEATVSLAQTRSKQREAIKASCIDEDQKATSYLETVTLRLKECKRWLDPNPFAYTPVRQRMLRTRRFKIKGNDLGLENRGKYGTVQETSHNNGHIFFQLDNGTEQSVTGIDFEKNAEYVMPQGLEVGRKLVITGLVKDRKYNGLHGHIKGVHRIDPERVFVASSIDNLELEVKFENCEFALDPRYKEGQRIKLVNLSSGNGQFNGSEATIVRSFDQDPSRILVRIDNGNRMCAVKPDNIEIVLPKGYAVGCRVVTIGLKKQSLIGKFGAVERLDGEDSCRAIVLLEPVGEQTVGKLASLRLENLRFALPVGLEVGRAVIYNGVKGRVTRADKLDSALVVVAFPEKNKTGKFVDKEQAVPLKELILQLPENLKMDMSVQLKDLKTKAYNDRPGFIRGASPQDPERIIVELEDGAVVQVRQRNFTIISF